MDNFPSGLERERKGERTRSLLPALCRVLTTRSAHPFRTLLYPQETHWEKKKKKQEKEKKKTEERTGGKEKEKRKEAGEG